MDSVYTTTKNDVKVFKQPCPYFSDRYEASIEAFMGYPKDISWYDKYLELGYRRTANIYYKNVCVSCDRCMPIRLPLFDFVMTASQKKTLNKNKDIVLVTNDSHKVEEKHISLYKHYMKKHNDVSDDMLDNLYSIHLGYINSIAMEYYLDDRLVAVSIVDETQNALSSVYCYYDYTMNKRRLGIYTLLKEIEFARSVGKKYCYLGFYIEELNSMNYKSSFIPNEIFDEKKWFLYKDS